MRGHNLSEIRYGLIGGRLNYSYSEAIHAHLMTRYSCFQKGEYHILEMPNLSFPEGYRGFNITNPYKNKSLVENVLRGSGYHSPVDLAEPERIRSADFTRTGPASFFCGLFEEERAAEDCYREILENAINTVFLDGKTYFLYNTDIFGFCLSFGSWIQESDACIVLGTGATSKMVRTLMHHLGIPCTVVGREGLQSHPDLENPCVVNHHIGPEKGNLQPRRGRGDTRRDAEKGRKRMLVNCTPIGTSGNPDPMSDMGIEGRTLSRFDFVADLVYNPESTSLVRLAREHGKEAKSGLEMLVAQAAMAQAVWNGVGDGLQDVVEETLHFLKKSH